MIPVSVSDLLKILDQIPIWKAVTGLPKRIAELERRVEQLEAERKALPATKPVDPAQVCPICEAKMKIVSETNDPDFGDVGLKLRHMECPECGHKTSRQHNGSKYA